MALAEFCAQFLALFHQMCVYLLSFSSELLVSVLSKMHFRTETERISHLFHQQDHLVHLIDNDTCYILLVLQWRIRSTKFQGGEANILFAKFFPKTE